MNNNKMKIVSVIVLLLFAGSFAMPFFVQENCDMPESNSSIMQIHFDIDMSDMSCCETMRECIVVPMHPIVSAPLNNVNLQKDLTVNYNISYSDKFNLIDNHSFFLVINMLCYSESHPSFQTPLLV